MEGLRTRRRPEKPHAHGCSQPPHPLQAISWMMSLVFVVSFYLMVIPVLPDSFQAAAGTFYSLNTTLCVVFGLFATLTDPTDTVVLEERKSKKFNLHFDASKYAQICTICKTHVHDYSKHCGQCDRCVDGFDHHCKWLNNCVGERNYRYFALVLVCADVQLGFQIAVSAYTTHGVMKGTLDKRLLDVYGLKGSSADLYAGALAALTVVLSICFLALLQLVLLHIWLRAHGLTTYEYIIQQRQQK